MSISSLSAEHPLGMRISMPCNAKNQQQTSKIMPKTTKKTRTTTKAAAKASEKKPRKERVKTGWKTTVVALSIPSELMEQIESERDGKRSAYFLRLIMAGREALKSQS